MSNGLMTNFHLCYYLANQICTNPDTNQVILGRYLPKITWFITTTILLVRVLYRGCQGSSCADCKAVITRWCDATSLSHQRALGRCLLLRASVPLSITHMSGSHTSSAIDPCWNSRAIIPTHIFIDDLGGPVNRTLLVLDVNVPSIVLGACTSTAGPN